MSQPNPSLEPDVVGRLSKSDTFFLGHEGRRVQGCGDGGAADGAVDRAGTIHHSGTGELE